MSRRTPILLSSKVARRYHHGWLSGISAPPATSARNLALFLLLLRLYNIYVGSPSIHCTARPLTENLSRSGGILMAAVDIYICNLLNVGSIFSGFFDIVIGSWFSKTVCCLLLGSPMLCEFWSFLNCALLVLR